MLYLADLDGNIFNRDEYERYLKVYKNGILHYGDINDFKEGDFFVLSSSLHHDEEAEKHAYEMGFRPKPRRELVCQNGRKNKKKLYTLVVVIL